MRGGGAERFLSLDNKICNKNKGDWTSVEKRIIFKKRALLNLVVDSLFYIPEGVDAFV